VVAGVKPVSMFASLPPLRGRGASSRKGELEVPPESDDVWVGRNFAKIVLRLGLTDWVMEKIAERRVCGTPARE
jgi:hypothetical protein